MTMSNEDKYGVAWQPDDEAKSCPLCEAEFGVFTRKHHCRFCGQVICADCSKNKAEHPKTNADETICKKCEPEHESICRAMTEAAAAAEGEEEASAKRIEQLTELFGKIDADGSKELEVAELKAVFGEHCSEFIGALDSDANKMISLEEWVTGIMEETKPLSEDDFNSDWVVRMNECIANRAEGARAEEAAAEEEPAAKPMSYKEFIATLADDIEPEEAQERYKEYKSKLPVEEEPVVPDKDMSEKFGVAWQPDVEVESCPHCQVEFGVFTRKHHCRFCGLIGCGSCCDNKEEHPVTQSMEKCCLQCFDIFEKERAAMAETEDAEAEEPVDEMADKYGVEWQADDAATVCNCCPAEFGVFTRKHHCRFCGLLVCANCNTTKAMHPKTEDEQNQCKNCANTAHQEAEAKRLNQRVSAVSM